MWKQILDYGRQLFNITQDIVAIKAEQAEMRRELKRISDSLDRLIMNQEKDQRIWDQEKEILLFKLQHQPDQFERRLPPAN